MKSQCLCNHQNKGNCTYTDYHHLFVVRILEGVHIIDVSHREKAKILTGHSEETVS